ncbi:MAG: hypothetical protein M3P96_12910 [Actinomycetota bacterium]|nr:hypothetical protein [Actinomycetota bacterium]
MAEHQVADDPAHFYLRHRNQIEEWAALRDDAREVVDRALRRVEVPLRAFAEDVGGEVVVKDRWPRPWPALTVTLPHWRTTSVQLSVGLAWDRRQLLVPHDNEWAWVGAYLQGEEKRLGTAVGERFARLADYHGYLREAGWPIWRYITPRPGPVDLTDYGELVLGEVRSLWTLVTEELGSTLQPSA